MANKERKMKVFYNPEMEDQPFPEPLSYKLLVETPEELKDISEQEATKLAGIEEGADKFSPIAGDMAYEDLVEYAKLGTTLQVGGYLKTILLDADYIQAGTITARKIQTASSGDRIVMDITGSPYPHNLLFYTGATLTGRIYSSAGFLNILAPGGGTILSAEGTPVLTLTNAGIGAGVPLIMGSHSISLGAGKTVDGVDISVLATNYNAFVALMAEHVGDANAHHNQVHSHGSHTGIGASDHHSSTSAGIAIVPSSVSATTILMGADCLPRVHDAGQVGYGDKHWDYIRGNHLLYHIDHGPFQHYDDIQLIKNIKIKDGKYDRATFPKEVFTDGMYDLSNINGFLIGTIKQLVERVEKLEKRIP